MPQAGPKRTQRYSLEFKAEAVAMSNQSDVLIKDVAEALDIHPFMLSRWRKEMREGKIMVKKTPKPDDPKLQAELIRLRQLEKDHKRLQMEHQLLKKAIQFCSNRNSKSLSS